MIYRPRFFDPRELVDPETAAKLGDRALIVFRPEALRMLDELREFLGVPITVNNWHTGGTYRFSGFRPASCTVGAPYSAHRVGAAFDLKLSGMTVAQAYEKIMANPMEPKIQRIRRIENIDATTRKNPMVNTEWLHVDVYEHPGKGILVVNP